MMASLRCLWVLGSVDVRLFKISEGCKWQIVNIWLHFTFEVFHPQNFCSHRNYAVNLYRFYSREKCFYQFGQNEVKSWVGFSTKLTIPLVSPLVSAVIARLDWVYRVSSASQLWIFWVVGRGHPWWTSILWRLLTTISSSRVGRSEPRYQLIIINIYLTHAPWYHIISTVRCSILH